MAKGKPIPLGHDTGSVAFNLSVPGSIGGENNE